MILNGKKLKIIVIFSLLFSLIIFGWVLFLIINYIYLEGSIRNAEDLNAVLMGLTFFGIIPFLISVIIDIIRITIRVYMITITGCVLNSITLVGFIFAFLRLTILR